VRAVAVDLAVRRLSSPTKSTDVVETAPFLDAIRGDLAAVSAGDETATAAVERLGRALESSLQLRLFDVMGQAALELSEQMPSGHVEVRLAGRDVQLVHVPVAATDDMPLPDDEGGTARLTLRMPEGLKTQVEQAAGREGISTNAWLVRAIGSGLDRSTKRRIGSRVTGFAQS
jgi:predicted HicB family RNase H-like nuclease